MQVLIQKYLYTLVIFIRMCYNKIKENAVYILFRYFVKPVPARFSAFPKYRQYSPRRAGGTIRLFYGVLINKEIVKVRTKEI